MAFLLFGGAAVGVELFFPKTSPTVDAINMDTARHIRNVVGAVLVALCIGAILMTGNRRLLTFLGPLFLEYYVAVQITIIPVLGFVNCKWYMARMSGVPEDSELLEELEPSYFGHILGIVAFTSVTHMVLPIRWMLFLPADVMSTLCSLVPMLVWGTPYSMGFRLTHILLVKLLITFLSYGVRRIESFERLAFATIVAEKSLRYMVEHEIEQMTRRLSPHQRRLAQSEENSSAVSTAGTGSMFKGALTGGNIQGSLQALHNLGIHEHWAIPAEDLDPVPGRLISRGGFGIVLPAMHHGTQIAVKATRAPVGGMSSDSLAALAQELRILRRIRHPNCVMFYGACIDADCSDMLLVLEYLRGVTLKTFIKKHDSILQLVERYKLLDDTCCALRYLHAQDPIIVHGDLKATNIMVEGEPRTTLNAKLLDFGLSRLMETSSRPLGGTLPWMPPEVILSRGSPPKPSADTFSFGRVLYMVMTGRSPLQGVCREGILEAARNAQLPPLTWPESTPLREECCELCDECLQFDAARRPSMEEVQVVLLGWLSGQGTSHPGAVEFPVGADVDSDGDIWAALHDVRRWLRSTEEAREAAAAATAAAVACDEEPGPRQSQSSKEEVGGRRKATL